MLRQLLHITHRNLVVKNYDHVNIRLLVLIHIDMSIYQCTAASQHYRLGNRRAILDDCYQQMILLVSS